jgi:hypothetical protein
MSENQADHARISQPLDAEHTATQTEPSGFALATTVFSTSQQGAS